MRLEWHLGGELVKTPQVSVWSCRTASESFDQFNRLAVALAKSQDHRASCGVFAFGLPNAVRQWLGKRYPVTRASQNGEPGRIPRGRWLKQSGIVRSDDMAPKSKSSRHRANFVYEHGKAVLCSNNHQRANMKRDKQKVIEYYKGKSANEVAELIKTKPDFMKSEEWFVLKAKTIAQYGCVCMKCKKTIRSWMQINVDHIKPRKYYPHLQNDPQNLQILCGTCNKEKGNKEMDYR